MGTNVVFFEEQNNYSNQDFSYAVAFAKEKLSSIPQFIKESYDEAHQEILGKPLAKVRRPSMAVRVNENIAGKLSENFLEFQETMHRKFFLYFDNFIVYIVKVNNGRLTPRLTKTAKDEINQTSTLFPDTPILHVGHEYKYGQTKTTLMFFLNGKCVWSVPFSYFVTTTNNQENDLNQKKNDNLDVFAKPKNTEEEAKRAG
jgi:hypothetical protein